MTANPNPAQFLTHGLKAQHRGPEKTAEEEHPHLLCPSARTHHKEKLRMHEQQQEKQTFRVEDEAQQVKVLVALAEVQYSVSSIHIRLLTTLAQGNQHLFLASIGHTYTYTHIKK